MRNGGCEISRSGASAVCGPDRRRAAALSGEDRDCASVDRARSKRAANRQLNAGWTEFPGEHQNVNHLPIGLRAADLLAQQTPEIIKRFRPMTAVAFLSQRQRTGERAGLSGQQLEIVVQARAGAELAVQRSWRATCRSRWNTRISAAPI